MKHRIVVLGAGYAGAFSAGYLARQLHSDDFEITVVNAEPDFVERLRCISSPPGRNLRHRPLAEVFAGTGITATSGAGDRRRRRAPDCHSRRQPRASTGSAYDTLLYALGSTAADHGVAGVDEHAFHVAGAAGSRCACAHAWMSWARTGGCWWSAAT